MDNKNRTVVIVVIAVLAVGIAAFAFKRSVLDAGKINDAEAKSEINKAINTPASNPAIPPVDTTAPQSGLPMPGNKGRARGGN
jgi:hypothetical protein